jgi:hypothetical protein
MLSRPKAGATGPQRRDPLKNAANDASAAGCLDFASLCPTRQKRSPTHLTGKRKVRPRPLAACRAEKKNAART